MKCPKCSFTSFDYLDSCQRCGTELRDVRTLLQIIAVSPEARTPNQPTPEREPERGAFEESSFGAEPAPGAGEPEPAPGEDIFEGLDFEESFEDLVEQTSYTDSSDAPAEPARPAEPAAPPPTEDEELLDLDFGDLFGEETEKKE